MNIGLVVEYDGSNFYGSQLQTDEHRTVQGVLEDSLTLLYGAVKRAKFASRTDRYVHALGQVGTFTADKELAEQTIKNALNDSLPDDVKVRHAQYVPPEFDPRRDAISRTYIYNIVNTAHPPVINRNYMAHIRHKLDLGLMEQAAKLIVGKHDFCSFAGPATPENASTIRNVTRAEISQADTHITFSITANAFLHQQVRRLVGALITVGTSRLSIEEFHKLITHGQRTGWTKMAPANGLTLAQITYKDKDNKVSADLPDHSENQYN